MEEFAEINVTPLTDVLLVLLIIFLILAALTVPPGFERSVPSNCACNSNIPPAVRPNISVTVARNGTISVNGVRIAGEALYQTLRALHSHTPQSRLRIFSDVHAPYGQIIRVLDAAKEAAITDVSFVV